MDARVLTRSAVSIIGGSVIAGSALAQEAYSLENWDHRQAYNGWSAEQLMDEADVYGQGGEEIGTVENLLINEQGQLVAMIAQVGGIWDIGDTHVAVPWEKVSFSDGRVMIPVTQDNVEEFSLFDDEFFTQVDADSLQTVDDDLETGRNIWKATNLINDYAVLESGAGVGYVSDLIISDKGKVQAVVVNASNYVDPGYYAYPWFADGYDDYVWDPGFDRYVLPYDATRIAQLDNEFDYDRMEGAMRAGAPGGEADEGAAGAEVGAGADTQERSNAGQDTQSGSQQ